jgi:amidase
MNAWNSLAVEGAMGRTVDDVALLLSVMSGPDPRAPLSIDVPGSVFLRPLERDFENTTIAWSPDLGRFAVEKEIVAVCEKALTVFSEMGCRVAEDHPVVGDAMEAFQALRAFQFGQLEKDYRDHAGLMKNTVVWNIEKGLSQKGIDVYRAEVMRTEFYHRVRTFLETYAFLLVPSTQVVPFPVEHEWVTEIDGKPMETYIDWMAINCVISLTGLPAISIPCGFTSDGLPVGLQIVGRYREDFSVLQLAHRFEKATRCHRRRPKLP